MQNSQSKSQACETSGLSLLEIIRCLCQNAMSSKHTVETMEKNFPEGHEWLSMKPQPPVSAYITPGLLEMLKVGEQDQPTTNIAGVPLLINFFRKPLDFSEYDAMHCTGKNPKVLPAAVCLEKYKHEKQPQTWGVFLSTLGYAQRKKQFTMLCFRNINDPALANGELLQAVEHTGHRSLKDGTTTKHPAKELIFSNIFFQIFDSDGNQSPFSRKTWRSYCSEKSFRRSQLEKAVNDFNRGWRTGFADAKKQGEAELVRLLQKLCNDFASKFDYSKGFYTTSLPGGFQVNIQQPPTKRRRMVGPDGISAAKTLVQLQKRP